MIIHHDFKEWLQLLENHKVEYMIVGGFAVAYHGYVRNTKDIDIFYRRSEDNINALKAAMLDFGFSETETEQVEFLPDTIITFGVPPLRVDLLNTIDGLDFENAVTNRVRGQYGDIIVWFIGRGDLIINKLATHRLQDQLDVEKLK